MGKLSGKVAVITGGSSGIGQACAVRFAREGADIVIGDLQDGAETIAKVEAEGRRAVYVKTNTTSADDCEALVAGGVEAFGHVDVGVCAAGIASGLSVEERQRRALAGEFFLESIPAEELTHVFNVNVTGLMLTGQALIRQMKKQGTGGSIVNIASSAGSIPRPGSGPYCVSKAGVIMLTKVMALELATTGIRVNAVGPGYTSTPMWTASEDSPAYQSAMSITPMNRNGLPEEQAAACLYLASDESSFMTGQTIFNAGGQFTG